MAHEETGSGFKSKPRGRPFPKGNKKGKLNDQAVASRGPTRGNVGENVSEWESGAPGAEATAMSAPLASFHHKVMESLDEIIKENINSPSVNSESDLTLIESIDFKNGDNVLKIRFSKKSNRMYRIQIFLNDQTEIRPVTYTGASTGYSFWNLLKGALKK